MADSSAITFEPGTCCECGYPIDVLNINGRPMLSEPHCKMCVAMLVAVSENAFMRQAHWEWKRRRG